MWNDAEITTHVDFLNKQERAVALALARGMQSVDEVKTFVQDVTGEIDERYVEALYNLNNVSRAIHAFDE